MLTSRFSRFGSSTLLALGLWAITGTTLLADHCSCEPACGCGPAHECGCSGGCGSPSDVAGGCPGQCPPGYYLQCHRPFHSRLVYKTLDSVAGGIEKLFGIHKLCCHDGCDSGCCDGAYGGGLEPWDVPLPPAGEGHPHPVPYAPHPANPSHLDPPPTAPQWEGPSESHRSPMRMGQPRVVEPAPQPKSLPDPFRDDARVSSRPQVRHSNYQQPTSFGSSTSHHPREWERQTESRDRLPRKTTSRQTSNPKQRFSRSF